MKAHLIAVTIFQYDQAFLPRSSWRQDCDNSSDLFGRLLLDGWPWSRGAVAWPLGLRAPRRPAT